MDSLKILENEVLTPEKREELKELIINFRDVLVESGHEIVKTDIKKLDIKLEGIIEPTTSVWVSPLASSWEKESSIKWTYMDYKSFSRHSVVDSYHEAVVHKADVQMHFTELKDACSVHKETKSRISNKVKFKVPRRCR